MIWCNWTNKTSDKEVTLVDGPILFGADERTVFPIAITLPHILGGSTTSDILCCGESEFTIKFTIKPDPPAEDCPVCQCGLSHDECRFTTCDMGD